MVTVFKQPTILAQFGNLIILLLAIAIILWLIAKFTPFGIFPTQASTPVANGTVTA